MATHHFNGFVMPMHDDPPMTISQQRTAHVQAVIKRLVSNSPIYTLLLSSIQLVSTAQGTVTTRLVLEDVHVNSRGTLHGAVSATIIDFVTGLAVASWDLRETTGASVDMHISYLGTANVGDTLEVVATAEKVGGSLSFSRIRIEKVLGDGGLSLVTLGQHTKYGRQANVPKMDGPGA